jgi:hypothetical protein
MGNAMTIFRNSAPTRPVTPEDSLAPLHQVAEYEVADHCLDVRGWAVRTFDDICIGWVDDLLVDLNLRTGTYLVVSVDADIRRAAGRCLHIAIGRVEIDAASHVVRTEMTLDQARSMRADAGLDSADQTSAIDWGARE